MKQSWIFFVTAAVVIALDQITKIWVRATLPLGVPVPEEWPIRLRHITNTGAAFGLFQDRSMLFVVIAIVAVGLILYYYRRLPADAWMVRLGLGLQLGGAIGNLIDRLHQGYVTDFIEFPYWPVFNIADSSIVIGVVLLGYYLLFVAPRETRQTPASQEDVV
ncbi:MAG: signal peptidase II [Chloroflexota bacterium]|nr:signal peptidase II [Dehalococcoidia bacterium]MDW8255324.1 signal peptidase II [Chloroflexota bacterium]